jgi:hypothetical protein
MGADRLLMPDFSKLSGEPQTIGTQKRHSTEDFRNKLVKARSGASIDNDTLSRLLEARVWGRHRT